jgi:hypothetical protein
MHRARAHALLILAGWLTVACVAHAQAWLPTRGSLDSTLSYTAVVNRKHYLPNGQEADAGTTHSETLALKLIYGISDRWAVSAGIPYVQSHYSGDRPHPGEVDDGHRNKTLTDWRLAVHYQLAEGPIALAPYLQLSSPGRDYPVLGHAAPGRGLDELWLGIFAGRDLDRWLPRTYVQARYNHAWVEKVAGVSHDRSNIDAELGIRVLPSWTLRAVVLWQETHGGIDVPIPPTDPLFPFHDQLASEDYTILGAGTSWAVPQGNSISLLYLKSARGRNGHKVDRSLTVSWMKSFTPQPR